MHSGKRRKPPVVFRKSTCILCLGDLIRDLDRDGSVEGSIKKRRMRSSFSFEVESASRRSADHDEHQIRVGGSRRGGGIVIGQSEMTVSAEAGMNWLATQALATCPARVTTRTNHLKCSLHLTVANIPSGVPPSNPAAAINTPIMGREMLKISG
jgi:hypothetical protein